MILNPVRDPLHRRRTELVLLALCAALIAGGFVLVGLGSNKAVPPNIVPVAVAVFVLFIVAHLGVRRLAPRADPVIVPLAVQLNGIGYVVIARLNPHLARQQAIWTFIGIVGFVVTLIVVRNVATLARLRFTIGLVGVALLVLPLVPGLGVRINGARIWVSFAGKVNFQPGEFAKVALAIFFAAYLVENRTLLRTGTFKVGPFMVPEPRLLSPVLVAWGFSLIVMMFQRDLGSALMFFMLFLTVLWIATERFSYLAIGSVLFAGGAYFSYAMFGHVRTRVEMWLDPWRDAQGHGYQIVQATYALAWGGVGGTGLGLGLPNRVPVAASDFIFAIIGEELGLAGTVAVVAMFALLVGCGLRVAVTSTDGFTKLLAVGLTTLLGVQSFLIMGGVTRLLPLTGLTLPFVSYGGSSLVSNWIIVALLVRMSDSVAERRAGDPASGETR
ncbi:MAG: FtsW/RodA/SpoVE family cell cycle protein [Microthrixaceae bacterium]